MRAVIQRCKQASVTVKESGHAASIGRGLLVLVGIGQGDSAWEAEWLATKILNLKLFPGGEDEDWGWKKSVVEGGFQLLSISQFTLYANTKKGFKPDFHGSMDPEEARALYRAFVDDLRAKYPGEDRIKEGQFQSMMHIESVLDGPATIILDSAEGCPPKPVPKAKPTAEEKAAYKDKLAKKAAAQKARRDQLQSQSTTPATDSGADSESGANEDKGAALAQRFKEAMTESY